MRLKPLLKRYKIYPKSGWRGRWRVIVLAALVGIVAGLGAISFHLMCSRVSHHALSQASRYDPDGLRHETDWPGLLVRSDADLPANSGNGFGEVPESEAAGRRPSPILWMLVLVPALGGLACGVLVYTLAPEAEGHGTDAAIEAYHHKRGAIRARVPLVKMLASAITLGTGGSGGREGPIAQIGAGFGSYLGSVLKLPDSERRSLLAAGLGAGIGAIFHAPLAGAIFACEVLYRDPDFEAENLIPAFIATTVAYSVYSLAFGLDAFKPLFEVVPHLTFTKPLPLLLPLAGLALVMAAASLLYTKSLQFVRNQFKTLALPHAVKPAIGGALTGLVAVALYFSLAGLGAESQYDALSVLSFGYGFLQKVLNSTSALAVTVLLAVGLGKIVTTSLTIGSGGSGGVFGPSMVIGGSLGALVGMAFHGLLPDVVGTNDTVIFALLGMASFFAAAANTPVSTLIMVSEMCSSYALLLPSMWVCALAYLLSRGWTVYENQVPSRPDSPAHRGDFIIDVLQGLRVKDAMRHATTEFVTVPLDMPLRDMSRLLTDTRQTCFPVVDAEGCYFGVFSLNNIRQFLYDAPVGELAVAADLVDRSTEPLALQVDLSTAFSGFADDDFEELPVVDAQDPRTVVGLLRRQDLIATYSTRLLLMRGQQKEDGA